MRRETCEKAKARNLLMISLPYAKVSVRDRVDVVLFSIPNQHVTAYVTM